MRRLRQRRARRGGRAAPQQAARSRARPAAQLVRIRALPCRAGHVAGQCLGHRLRSSLSAAQLTLFGCGHSSPIAELGTRRDDAFLDACFDRIRKLGQRARSLRCSGSCALNLCSVAQGRWVGGGWSQGRAWLLEAGENDHTTGSSSLSIHCPVLPPPRLDVFYEVGLGGCWDLCAGALVLAEAGGRVLDPQGAPWAEGAAAGRCRWGGGVGLTARCGLPGTACGCRACRRMYLLSNAAPCAAATLHHLTQAAPSTSCRAACWAPMRTWRRRRPRCWPAASTRPTSRRRCRCPEALL